MAFHRAVVARRGGVGRGRVDGGAVEAYVSLEFFMEMSRRWRGR